MRKKILFLFIFCVGKSYGQCNNAAPVTYNLAPTAPNEIYITNAIGRGWKGKDTVKIAAGHYTTIEIDNFHGDSCNPIVIINTGGQVVTDKMVFGGGAEYFKVMGSGDTNVTYGFKVVGIQTALRINKARNYEFSYMDISNPSAGNVGVLIRYDPNLGDTASLYPNYRMAHIRFHDCFVHDCGDEGFYVGSSDPSGTDPTYTPPGKYPNRLDSLWIFNCWVTNCGWDGIQVSCAGNDVRIYNNLVTHFGTLDVSSQRAGTILGSASSGSVYNNTIKYGTGNAIELYGYGAIKCYGNTIDSTGTTTNGNVYGEENIYTADYSVSPESVPKQTIEIYNNAINHPPLRGAIKVNSAYGNYLSGNVHDNTFCIPGAAGNWQSTYISLPAATTNTNNTLDCGITPLPPAPCNCIITNIKFVN